MAGISGHGTLTAMIHEKDVQPHPVKKMFAQHPHNTICETLRQAYQKLEPGRRSKQDIKDAQYLLRVAVTMARSMNRKLEEYKAASA